MTNAEELAARLYDLAGDFDAPDYSDTAGRDIEELAKELETTRRQCKTLYKLLEIIGG